MDAGELYSAQDVETKVILPELVRLGYDESRRAENGIKMQFQHPITVHQGSSKKTIPADVVVFVHDTPIIVIDSKNPREYLTEGDREQVISYARLIGEIAPYAVLCNGGTWQVFDTITKQQIRGLPKCRDLVGDIQKRRLPKGQRESIQSQATRLLFAIDSARDLSQMMRRCHDTIRNLKGFDPTRAFDELSKVLFSKMFEERELSEGRRADNRFTLESVRRMRNQGVEIVQTLWQDTIASERYRDVFSDTETAKTIDLPPEAIDKIVEILENKSLGLTDLDVKGVAFEEFLSSTYRGGGLGQFFTPREVVNFMVDLAEPGIGDKIIDPSCGTGGFLIRVYDIISDKIRTADLSKAQKKEHLTALANTCLAGIDWEPRAARTCKMNMIIHGDGHAGVYQGNALDLQEIETRVTERQRYHKAAPSISEGQYDIVLTNPPFGASDTTRRILDYYELGRGRSSQKREVILLERCIRLLRPGGKLVAVIPEGILSNKNDRTIRNYISHTCSIKAIIRLPQDAFRMSEGAACTSVILATKKDVEDEQGDIFFARAEYIGISAAGKPIPENDLVAIREHYRDFCAEHWEGIELRETDATTEFVRESPAEGNALWLEPEVNRTSLLYDRLSYILRSPRLNNRFSYTYNHPAYIKLMQRINSWPTPKVMLQQLCIEGYPARGVKPKENSAEGYRTIKVRNVTGKGIDWDTEYAPITEDISEQCARGILKNGDVLITSTGEGTIGRVDHWHYDDPAIADGHITICRLRPDVDVHYVVEFLRSEYGQIQMLRHVSGSTGQTELLRDHLSGILIPLPHLSTQRGIVGMMQAARAEHARLGSEAATLKEAGIQALAAARSKMAQVLESAPNPETAASTPSRRRPRKRRPE